MFERFTKDARQTVVQAQEECQRLGHSRVDTAHLLLALLNNGDGPGARALKEHQLKADDLRERARQLAGTAQGALDGEALATIGIDLDEVRRTVEATFGTGALDRGRKGHKPFSPQAKKTLELALREAIALRQRHICGGHILLGLLRATGNDNIARRILSDAGVDLTALRTTTTRIIQADAA